MQGVRRRQPLYGVIRIMQQFPERSVLSNLFNENALIFRAILAVLLRDTGELFRRFYKTSSRLNQKFHILTCAKARTVREASAELKLCRGVLYSMIKFFCLDISRFPWAPIRNRFLRIGHVYSLRNDFLYPPAGKRVCQDKKT